MQKINEENYKKIEESKKALELPHTWRYIYYNLSKLQLYR